MMTPALHSRAQLEVDLAALVRNARACAAHAARPVLPMIKADAYGLGAVACARALEVVEPWAYGVATVSEGEELRAAGITRRILIFTPLTPADLARAHHARLTPTLGSATAIADWRAIGGGAWHLAIETGMARAGVRWDELATLPTDALASLEGAFTHFHSAERPDGSRELQETRFREALAALPSRPTVLHAENSAGLARRAPSEWDVVRPGVFLYGVGSGDGAALTPEPVAHLRAPIVELHTLRAGETVSYDATWRAPIDGRRIATLAMGYADGYRRALSNRGTALIHGQPAPIVGLVTMDMTMVDVTDVTDVTDVADAVGVGTVATVLGRDGSALLTLEEVARTAELSPYELLTGLRQRADRVYTGGGA
ncbi:MAG: alanine racemase [Gemmatimonadaceae bacterium]|nr:alanine racemase [Gemmatimonadaceae bacterium]